MQSLAVGCASSACSMCTMLDKQRNDGRVKYSCLRLRQALLEPMMPLLQRTHTHTHARLSHMPAVKNTWEQAAATLTMRRSPR